MCGIGEAAGHNHALNDVSVRRTAGLTTVQPSDLLDYARHVVALPELRTGHVGFVGYGNTRPGDRVLLAVDTQYDPDVVDVLATALRERGALVDVLTLEYGPDREFSYLDEVEVSLRRGPWEEKPRRWEGVPWVEKLAEREGYNLLIHGKGGPVPKTPFRYVELPWLGKEHFTRGCTTYPRDVLSLVNQKTWDVIWNRGRGGKVHLTDPEGTDLTYSLHEEYFDGSHYAWVPEPTFVYGHLMGHPTPPLPAGADAEGVAAGTTSHFARAFPNIRVTLDGGQVVKVDGGGQYGAAWAELLDESRKTQYLHFPRPGLFYLWEVAIGTHPKVIRPSTIGYHSSGGFEWERRRSGVIHLGFGTLWRHEQEAWAAERGILYGHLHIHLLFPTYEVIDRQGGVHRIIDRGRLVAMDDPEVRELASKFGDPDELLRENWIPSVPGITAAGDYAAYAADPARFIYGSG